MVKEVASKTSDIAGDGTTTATLLVQAIVNEGFNQISAGANPVILKKGIDRAISKALKMLDEKSVKIEDKKKIEEVGEKRFVEEFIEWAYDFLEKHDKYIMKYSEILKKESTTYLSKLENVNEKLKDIREKIEKLNNEINSYVKLEYMDIITYRHILSLKLNQELRGEKGRVVSEYIIPIIHSMGLPKLCTDGCESCVVFYRGCNETYLQNYTVSKTLALKFLEILKKKHFPIVGEGLGRILEDLMEKSKKVKIYTPFIDEYGLSLLRKLREKGIDVEVVTRIDDKDNLVFINELQSTI